MDAIPPNGRRSQKFDIPKETLESLKGVTLDEIEFWLETVMAAKDVTKGPGGRHLFTPWERSVIESFNDQYDSKHLAGYHDQPLSPKQLFYLQRMFEQLASDTRQRLEEIADKEP